MPCGNKSPVSDKALSITVWEVILYIDDTVSILNESKVSQMASFH